MATTNFQIFNYTFLVVCLIVTIGLSVFSIARFVKNEDTTLVKDTKFLSSQDAIYPSLSFCILPPFLENNFKIYENDGINMSSYIDFLKGNHRDDRLLRIEYDNVTVSLADNMIEGWYKTNSDKKFGWSPTNYVSFRGSKRKCFTVDAPISGNESLWKFTIEIKNNIFPDGGRSPTNEIRTYLHYPGQIFTAYNTLKYDFVSEYNSVKNYYMEFQIRNVDVITRRNKANDNCVDDWKNYDNYVMKSLMNKVGCHPPNWKTDHDLPDCSTAAEMESFSWIQMMNALESFVYPCRIIDRLDFSYEESEIDQK